MIQFQPVLKTWTAFQNQIHAPTNEAEYLELIEFARILVLEQNLEHEPVKSLFRLVSDFVGDWEKQNEPPIEVTPRQTLAFLMEQHGLSQHALARAIDIDQGTLSKILGGQRSISKSIASKLAKHFKLNVGAFL
jgi:HTH-type transcriptional regulator / antitoxin HigA